MGYYDQEFYGFLGVSSSTSALAVVPLVMDLVNPESVLDIGCGAGEWLKVFVERGVQDFAGVDGPWVEESSLRIPSSHFRSCDLQEPVDLGRKFDLVVSLEVAEHIDASHAMTFVDSLTRHSDVVLFSAAIPGQGGTLHVNEQWPTYWADMFRRNGFVSIDCIRPAIWNDPRVAFWYAQNALLFVREERLANDVRLRAVAERCGDEVRALVHPRLYEQRLTLRSAVVARARQARDWVRRLRR